MTPFALMGIGISGSGKSTVLTALSERFDIPYISRDDLMEEVTGNPHEQSIREEIGNACDNLALMHLSSAGCVIVDSTFVDSEKRRRKIQHLRLTGADVVLGLYMETPYAVASERNRKRRFVVAEPVVREQYRKLLERPPSVADGLDDLFHLHELPILEQKLACLLS